METKDVGTKTIIATRGWRVGRINYEEGDSFSWEECDVMRQNGADISPIQDDMCWKCVFHLFADWIFIVK